MIHRWLSGAQVREGKRESGATLVELVMTIVIISIAIAGVVGAFALITGRSSDPLNQTRAVELAQLYMDEIITKKYDDNTPPGGMPRYSGSCSTGPEAGESRDDYDDVDDYNGLFDQPPASADGGTLTGYQGFSASVTVICAGAEVGLASSEAKRINVSIVAPGGQDFIFSAYRANF